MRHADQGRSAEALDLPGIKGRPPAGVSGRRGHHVGHFRGTRHRAHVLRRRCLRLGVLYDLLGRFHHHDMRDSTVTQFRRRYQVEGDQVERVEATALSALAQISAGAERDRCPVPVMGLPPPA